MTGIEKNVALNKRFAFGKNWSRFLRVLDDDRIVTAEKSLMEMLSCNDLTGKRFLDIGSGSGLFSLAARRLGASVYSFDFDPQSVACTETLKRRYFPEDKNWSIKAGSVLDKQYLESLGMFDIVYSWGVLHHTGAMWQALEQATIPLNAGSCLYVAIYNDQGSLSHLWKQVKQINCSGFPGKTVTIGLFFPVFFFYGLLIDVVSFRNPAQRYAGYKSTRGMSVVTDWLDWLGGYPFEVAKPDQVIDFYKNRGYRLEKFKPCAGRLGCNEFVFKKEH